MRRLLVPLLLAAIACGSKPAVPPTARELYELGPMGKLAWLLGDWKSETGTWHWVAAGDKIYGVAFDPRAYRSGFAVMIIEEEREAGQTEGVPWLQAYEGPESFVGVRFHQEASVVRFRPASPEGLPFELTFSSEAGELRIARRRPTVKRTLGTAEFSWLKAYNGERAPELEQVDRALAEAVNSGESGSVATHGATWAAAFAADGAYWCERCVGGAPGRASEADLAPRNNPGRFDWAPISSRRAGDLGFTVGHMSYRPRLALGVWRATYLTVWRREADGRWSMLFYTRRSAPATLSEPE